MTGILAAASSVATSEASEAPMITRFTKGKDLERDISWRIEYCGQHVSLVVRSA